MDAATLTSLREQMQTKRADAERISKTFDVDEKGRFSMSPEKARDFTRTVKEADEIKAVIDAAEGLTRHAAYLDGDAAPSAAAGHYGAQGQAVNETKSLADVFLESKAYKRAEGEGWDNLQGSIRATLEGKSIFSLSAGQHTVNALGSHQDLGITELRRRKMHIRDLFPKSSTKASVLTGIRETGWVNNAKQVKERYAADGISPRAGADTDVFGKAPRSKLQLTPVMFPVAEIAHLLDAHKNILADEPRLRTFINTRMVEGVKFAEDFDLLHSVGDGEKITGLFNTPGIQEYTGVATDKYSIQIRRGITKALLAEYEPTGIVLSPSMWENVEIEEDDNGAFRVAVAVAIGAEKRVWRLNVVETTAMQDEQYLLGAFGMGAQLHDREAVSVTASTENNDNYERGVVTFRADERLALEVVRPESFVVGTWTDAA